MTTLKDKLLESPKTLLTAVVVVGWAASFVVRLWKPEFTLGAAFDATTTTTVGYWFSTQKQDGAA